MKKPLLILAGSVAANVGLYLAFATRNPVPALSETTTVPAAVSQAATSAVSSSPSGGTTSAAGPAAAPSSNPLITPEVQELNARLRAAGFPEEIIRAAVISRLQDQYLPLQAEIYSLSDEIPPYWTSEGGSLGMLTDPDKRAAAQKLGQELTAALKELFGPGYPYDVAPAYVQASMQQNYGDLPMDKISQIQQNISDYSLRQQEIRGVSTIGTPTILLPAEREQLAQLDAQRLQAIKDILTPDEYEQYELRTSSTANTLRSQLAAFEPTEQEYLTIYRLQKAFDDQYPTNTLAGVTPQIMQERQAHQQELQQQIMDALPPDRVEDYKMATLPGAQIVSRLVTRLDLPQSTTRDLLALQQNYQQQAAQIRSNRNLDPSARTQQLAGLATQAGAELTAKLGPSGFEAYQAYGGGWLRSLNPPVARGGPTVLRQ